MASIVGTAIAKKAYKKLTKDQNLLVPLDNVRNTRIVSDQKLKSELCPSKKKKKKTREKKSILDRVLERL